MNVSLTRELERFVNRKVKSGLYHSASEVVRAGLRLMQEREKEREWLRKEIAIGIEQLERGEYTEYDDASLKQMVERIKTEGRMALAY